MPFGQRSKLRHPTVALRVEVPHVFRGQVSGPQIDKGREAVHSGVRATELRERRGGLASLRALVGDNLPHVAEGVEILDETERLRSRLGLLDQLDEHAGVRLARYGNALVINDPR